MTKVQECRAAGPWVRVSPSFEKQVYCNRIVGHQQLDPENPQHRFYDVRTFKVVAEWVECEEPDPRTRRRVQDYEATQHEVAAKRAGKR